MGLQTIIFLTAMALTVAMAQSDCTWRLYTCSDVYTRSSYSQTERDDFINCLNPVNCSMDPNGQALKTSLMDAIANSPITAHNDGASTAGLSLFLALLCLALYLTR